MRSANKYYKYNFSIDNDVKYWKQITYRTKWASSANRQRAALRHRSLVLLLKIFNNAINTLAISLELSIEDWNNKKSVKNWLSSRKKRFSKKYLTRIILFKLSSMINLLLESAFSNNCISEVTAIVSKLLLSFDLQTSSVRAA